MFRGIKITKEELFKLNEKDIMFITNPGRMGDEDGSTFIIKKDNDYIMYRVGGWMYGKRTDEFIFIDDLFTVFPLWKEMWNNSMDETFSSSKYEFIYMGFGNGLSVDKSIYDEYYKYLIDKVKKHKSYNLKDGDNYNPSINISVWDEAFFKYAKDHNIKVRKPN